MMEYLKYLCSTPTFDICFKLLLSCLLAGIIGLERSAMNKPAGFGTHAILGVSAALVVIASEYMAKYYDVDAARIPAQVIAGIGFIGAGTILRTGVNVRGVTTAAGIFAVTCIGIAVGVGYYSAAIISTIIVFLILSHNPEIRERFERYESINLIITIADEIGNTIDEVSKYFKKEGIQIQSIKKDTETIKSKSSDVIKISISYDTKKTNKSEILSELISMKKIKEVAEEK